MMKSRFLAFCLSGLAALAVSGCDYVPGPRQDAINAVRDKLIDPYSAKFEDVDVCPGNHAMYRGRVNAKNRMGAYVGATEFYTIHNFAFLSDGELEQLLQRRGYSYIAHLSSACRFGTDPDLQKYMAAVEDGSAPTLSELVKETDEQKRARLGLPPAT